MKTVKCSSIQEAIAIGETLGPDEQSHFNQCEKCKMVLQEFRQLEELFLLNFEIDVPDSFADAVMNRIEQEASLAQEDWFSVLQIWVAKLIAKPVPPWALVSFGVAMSASNVMRFVFYILTPIGN